MAVVENRIFVNGVPMSASQDDLRQHFEQFGATVDVYMPRVHGTMQHKGMGFITYAVNESVNVCVSQPGHSIHGTPVQVDLCLSKDKGGGKGKGEKGAGNLSLPGHVNNGDRLFITKIPPDATKEEVEALFSKYGSWTDVFLPNGNFPGGHKGICFISYTDTQSAQLAMTCGPHQLHGQDLVVEIATPRGDGSKGGKGGGKFAYQQPAYQQPAYQQPVYQQPAYQQPQEQQWNQQQQYGAAAPAVHQPVVVPAPNWQNGYPAAPVGGSWAQTAAPPAQAWQQPQQQAWAPQVIAPPAAGTTVGLKPGRLFLTKVGPDVTKDDLTAYFQQYGELQDVYVPVGKSIAFVSFSDPTMAQQVVATSPEHEVKLGRMVTIDLAYDRPALEAKGKGKFRYQPYN